MNLRLGPRILQPVWLPIQLAAITLFLRWSIQPPSRPGWERAADAGPSHSAAISLTGVLPTDPQADSATPVPMKVRLGSGFNDQELPASPAPSVEHSSRRMRFLVTAYCPCQKCCGRWAHDHRTASGRSIRTNGGQFVASDTRVLPFHTCVRIPGYAGGRPVPVLDRGGKIKGRRLDVFFFTHAQAARWGKRWLTCEVLD